MAGFAAHLVSKLLIDAAIRVQDLDVDSSNQEWEDRITDLKDIILTMEAMKNDRKGN